MEIIDAGQTVDVGWLMTSEGDALLPFAAATPS